MPRKEVRMMKNNNQNSSQNGSQSQQQTQQDKGCGQNKK